MEFPTLTFIGAGNVATHYAKAFFQAGCRVSQVWSRNQSHADVLASQVNATPISDLKCLCLDDVDVFFLAVRDDAIETIVSQLRLNDRLLLHTAGSVSMRPLSCATSRYGVLWPVQSLVASAQVDYREMPLCYEGCTAEVDSTIASLGSLISSQCYRLDEEQRRWAHLYACVVSNFGNALNAVAQTELSARGVDFSLLRPLVAATAQKAWSEDVWRQQTGAALRRDVSTMEAHRRLLSSRPELLRMYDCMTEVIQSYCHQE
ncbi:MAG: DUF2520 domain-containing protein [Bacteroidales bacterium]|nr:DUF2520 domain-containing protein [Bacteroidales bacterium]